MSLERGRYYAILGALVTRERKRKKLTQVELGKRLDIHQSTVARIEAGKLKVEVTLFRLIAQVLFDRSTLSLDGRIHYFADLYRLAEEAVNPQRIASRDGERSLIDYVVEVAA
ncbi:MAG TPA: helix-turn-helix transcriptional regulator [Vicinamibacterales bacterium]|jgi:transcriptional regulator with XRE-family HTH domain|nr:helix-turn-helix transcriptional regulator [Vicinamibacterales bacterium]